MAIVYIEGFDLVGSTDDIEFKGAQNAEGNYLPTGGINGGGALQLDTDDNVVLAIARPAITYTTISFWFKTISLSSAAFFVSTYDDLTVFSTVEADKHMSLLYNTEGKITLYGDSQVFIAQSVASVLVANTWHHIEILTHRSSSGNTEVFVDGISVMDEAGDFHEGNLASSVVFNGVATGHNYDDIVIQEDGASQPAALGFHEIEALLPDGAGTNSAWTGTFADVDDPLTASSDGDSTYISESVLNDKHDFTLDDLSGSPTTIHAIQQVIEARKDDAGIRSVTPFIISNAVTGNGTEVDLFQPYVVQTDIFELDPDGAVAWDTASVNALQAGVEITT